MVVWSLEANVTGRLAEDLTIPRTTVEEKDTIHIANTVIRKLLASHQTYSEDHTTGRRRLL
ncbi:hypothetical protein N7520_005759 [Penicillium odoratum]|uniref:uncharacterized protein n=1 Tax=Penicillium odoratum TaxID=1167516 RepID=UPI0025466944|nr:uncharacterized protein N7520_005759 [Penicillium odoratum]KAJ5758603.1 hypothetical protein N7520_005759 [Penicillium odoratum]